MAPSKISATVNVVSCSVLSHDQSILVEAGSYAPVNWFLRHALDPYSGEDDDDGPPKKKRKMGWSKSMESEALDHSKHIPISKVALHLSYPASVTQESPDEEEILREVSFDGSVPVEVVPMAVNTFEDGTQIRLSLPRKRGAILVVDCPAIEAHVSDALRNFIPQLRYAGSKKLESDAVLRKCTLTECSGSGYSVVRLDAVVYWRSGISASPASVQLGKPRIYHHYNLLAEAFPDDRREVMDQSQEWSANDFYASVHVPEQDRETRKDFEAVLDSDLYPFQKRAVHWMLGREGVIYGKDGVQPTQIPKQSRGVNLYQCFQDVNGDDCFVSHLQGIIQRNKPQNDPCRLSGGLLAEEMGLGKTVELMALMSVHKRSEKSFETYIDPEYDIEISPSKATLIITPNSILQQWKSELERHAPALKVFHYEGVTSKKAKDHNRVIAELATRYDVVLATYNTLGREVHFAEDPPDRDMRHARKFERKRSPLVQVQWWRICLDEAQMVESGVTAAARVARRLPRVHSWAVSGTPVRKTHQDLHGLLIFLGYRPLNEDTKLWSHLIANHRHLFRSIFGMIAIRHTKAQIREDLQLPQQKRLVISTPFTAIEQQNYGNLMAQMCDEVGVSSDGSPKSDDWDPDDPATIEAMRNWLVRLRQSCLHPQVGGKNRKTLGRGKGPLRTVHEVLDVMIEQNETEIRVEERNVLNAKLLRAHIIGNNREEDRRAVNALEIYEQAMNRSSELVEETRSRLIAAKQAAVRNGEVASDVDDEDSLSEITPRVGRIKNSLKSALQLQHTCIFFAATACYQIKTNIDITEPESEAFMMREEQETALYERAKVVRKEVLAEYSRKSEALMSQISNLVKNDILTSMPQIKDLKSLGGIESRRIVEKSDELFDRLRDQAQVIAAWRVKMAEYLTKPLVDKDEGLDTTGDEYEDSTKLQDELYVYFDAVKAIWWDLNTFITGEKAPLIDHEVKTAIKAAKTWLNPEILDELKQQVHAPELALELFAVRNKLRGDANDYTSIRGLIAEARAIEGSFQGSESGTRAAERVFLQQHIQSLQAVLTAQSKALAKVEKEIELFRQTQNQRLEFYRQLQELSDTVQPWRDELDLTMDLQALGTATAKEDESSAELKRLRSKNKFLHTLEKDSTGERQNCMICLCPFLSGILTVCGHSCCKDCMIEWTKSHKSCPHCRHQLTSADMHNITYNPLKLKAREEVSSGPPSAGVATSSVRNDTIYSDVDPQLLQEIQSIDLPASYSTKIDTLGRHLHWIREHDPGAKSIVFSQYREFLDMLGTALRDFRIGYARLGRGGAVEKFKKDPSIDCLLLDAKTDSSGMTLVNATHVFLCEPLIQTAVELQAIARVHRIGQTRPTTVWQYFVNDTVEEQIYETSVQRRLQHVRERQSKRAQKSSSATPTPLPENAIEAANSDELQMNLLSKLLTPGKSGGELVQNEDLWYCLFGKASRATPAKNVEDVPLVVRHLRVEAAEARRADGMRSRENADGMSEAMDVSDS